MKVEAKYGPGDWVWLIEDNKVCKKQVAVVKTWTSLLKTPPSTYNPEGKEVTISKARYLLRNTSLNNATEKEWEPEQLFESKEKLLLSL